jgi:DNA-binding transcriptional MerR regulator/methylmalonyl-CoA mutase cobalamin-binding subunit
MNGATAQTSTKDQPGLLSIGDLARIAGVSPDTIRVWEKRYGRPEPVRLPSGHRRYTSSEARWLRRVAEALAMGHRPSRIATLEEEDLDALLFPAAENGGRSRDVRRILELVFAFEEKKLRSELRRLLKQYAPRGFLVRVLIPLLDSVGRAWVDGELEIRHEHFLTEILEDILRTMRLSIERPTGGPRIVLATLPGETHGFGLQMAAVVCRLAGLPTRILGVDTPLPEIRATVREARARAVAISVSLATGGVETDRRIRELRAMLPDDVRIVVGGRGARGARRGPRGVDYFQDLETFETWLKKLKEG